MKCELQNMTIATDKTGK